MKYIGKFQDINEQLYTINLITNGEDTTEVVLGDSPIIIESTNSDHIYKPCKYSNATIKLITDNYIPDLYTGEAQGVKVELIKHYPLDTKLWVGFLTPNIYSQGYEALIEELELEAIDGLSTLQYFKYTPITGEKSIMKLSTILKQLISKCNCYNTIAISDSVDLIQSVDNMYISEQNFFDEDDEPMTCQEVLEEICRYANVTAIAIGETVYFVDLDAPATFYSSDLNPDSEFVQDISRVSEYSVNADSYTENGTQISLDSVYNKAIIKDSLYSFDSIIPSIWDNDDLVNYGGMWNYHNEIEVVDEDGKGGKHKCFFKYYHNPNYKSYYYDKESLQSVDNIETVNYATTQQYVGATICRAYFKKIEDGKEDLINNINYTDYLLLHTHNTNSTLAGYVDVPFTITDIEVENDVGLPLFELQANNSNPAFIGGVNTHILIQGNFIFMDRKNEMYIMQGYTNKEDDFNTNNLWIKSQLKYGNKYWNGDSWQDTECCFKLPFYDNGQKDHHINQTFPIKNSVSWEMGIEEEGYLVSLPENNVLGYKPTFTLYQPHRIDDGYRCDAVWLKNFDIKVVIAHPNQDIDRLEDSDTEYSNVIDEGFIGELEEDFKICTWDNKEPNYSAVCYNTISNTFSFIDCINNKATGQYLRPEQHRIYKLVNQYSTPSIKLDISLEIMDLLTVCKLPVIDSSKKFIIDSYTIDYRYNKMMATLIEKK